MASNRNVPNPVRTLVVLFAVLGLLTGVMFLQGTSTPKLGLDLAGGTTVTMTAQTESGKNAPAEQMDQAIKIIRDRVNGSGLTDAEVTKQGDNVIVVSVPGDENDQKQIIDLVGTTAQLQFRQVLVTGVGSTALAPTAEPTAADPTAADPTVSPTRSPAVTPPGPSAEPSAKPSGNNRALSGSLVAEPTASPGSSPSKTPSPEKSDDKKDDAESADEDAAGDAGEDFSKVDDKKVVALYKATNCGPNGTKVPGADDANAKYVVSCETDGSYKYILGPTRVHGTEVDQASAQPPNSQTGQNGWEVALQFKKKGAEQFGQLTKEADQAYQSNPYSPEAQIAIVLDGQVMSAPSINQGAILGGTASISGGSDFNQEYSEGLAQVLKYGALPLKFPEDKRTVESISSSLGADQLRGGLIAGGIGLILVVLYCFLYYRALGLVAVLSLGIAAAITYLSVVILGENLGFRLSLPHIIGLIVSIGITADSFIIYFERLRDELKLGRSLRPSVESSWTRARRTIIVADSVTFLAALVLYFLAVGGIRGFAFAMGLTTLIDLVVVFFFTKPLVAVLARRKFFATGHKWSGLDSIQLSKPTPHFRATKHQEA
ncbi:protein translocase subunit SecD [Actinocorallia aurantiaca]|uniref:Protein translocase subunit SecD n=1 Tax=Actinocorallia aurantiaca TaxID=46204 RepID=A0ABN3UPL8_9ACTN